MSRPNIGWRYLAPRALRVQRTRLRGLRRRRAGMTAATSTSVELAKTGRAVRTVVHPAEPVSMRRPTGLTGADWAAFRIRDVEELPEQFVLDVRDVTVSGKYGWVFCDGQVVSDLWQEEGFPTESMVGAPATDPSPRRLEGTTSSLLLPWMPNYYHWTLQSVPRFSMLSGVVAPEDVDHWLVPEQAPFVDQWLDRLGVPARARVVVSEWTQSVEVERLVVASIPARNRYIPTWVVDDVVARQQPDVRDAPRLLFIDRPGSDKRRLLNRDEVLRAVRDRGFAVVELAGLSVTEQAALFASADVVAAVLGAGLTNLVYCRPGTHVIEILPANLMFPAYYKLADAVGLDHHLVRGTEPALPRPFRFPDTESDVVADLEALVATLDDVLARMPAA